MSSVTFLTLGNRTTGKATQRAGHVERERFEGKPDDTPRLIEH